MVEQIAVRAWPVIQEPERPQHRPARKPDDWRLRWPRLALVFDTETRIDHTQALILGCYRVLYDGMVVEEGIFTHEEQAYRPAERAALDAWCAEHPRLMRRTRREWLKDVFYPVAYRAQGVVVGFNLPFDLSRIAERASPGRGKWARGRNRWSLTLLNHINVRGEQSTRRATPRVRIDPGMGNGAAMAFVDWPQGHFLDCATLAAALTGERLSLARACETFGVEAEKSERPALGSITTELLDYCRQDVAATAALYERLMERYSAHPLSLPPDRVYSAASIGKAYLTAMGARPAPISSRTRYTPDELRGLGAVAYYGARAECRIRRTPVPVAYLDFRAMYPTVNILQSLWEWLVAKRVSVLPTTMDARRFLSEFEPADFYDDDSWMTLRMLCRVQPQGDPLIHRARVADGPYSAYTLLGGPLTLDRPMWWTLADCLIAKWRGQAPEILEAVEFVPLGLRDDLCPIQPPGMPVLDPRRDDPWRAFVEARAELNARGETALAQGAKVLANATSYGILFEMQRQEGERRSITAHGLETWTTTAEHWERPGAYCEPILAAFVTAGARLMLTLAELAVKRCGGHYVTMDTDALTVVAQPNGGLVECAGGNQHMSDWTGHREVSAIQALSYQDVQQIVKDFQRLDPYDDGQPLLRWQHEDAERPLYCYAVASKRYALYHLTTRPDGAGRRVEIVEAREHGLGPYLAPQGRSGWVETIWQRALDEAHRIDPEPEPEWYRWPVLSRQTIATPGMLAWFTAENRGLPYHEQVKPFGFVTHPLLKRMPEGAPADFCLVTPFERPRAFRDLVSGQMWTPDADTELLRYAELAWRYVHHPEGKFLDHTGQPCQPWSRGLLFGRADAPRWVQHIGKESNALDLRQARLIREADALLVYQDDRNDWHQLARTLPARVVAEACGVNERTVWRWRSGRYTPKPEYRATLLRLAERSEA